MPYNKARDNISGGTFMLIWSPEMMLIFLYMFEEQDNLGKHYDKKNRNLRHRISVKMYYNKYIQIQAKFQQINSKASQNMYDNIF